MLHSIRTILAHFLGYMTVGIQGELGGCMAEIGLNSFNIVSHIEGGNGETVARIMESGIVRDRDSLALHRGAIFENKMDIDLWICVIWFKLNRKIGLLFL